MTGLGRPRPPPRPGSRRGRRGRRRAGRQQWSCVVVPTGFARTRYARMCRCRRPPRPRPSRTAARPGASSGTSCPRRCGVRWRPGSARRWWRRVAAGRVHAGDGLGAALCGRLGHLVKAASARRSALFAASYREEARKLRGAPGRRAGARLPGWRGRRLGGARASSTSAARAPRRPWGPTTWPPPWTSWSRRRGTDSPARGLALDTPPASSPTSRRLGVRAADPARTCRTARRPRPWPPVPRR